MEDIEIISKVFNINNIQADKNQIEQLYKFYQLLIEYNKTINLTSITEITDVSVKHFADCLIYNNQYKQNSTVCDIGCGAGFPSIPLKILRPDLNITMVDSLQKRINFLNTVIKELNLTNISTIHSRAQELTQHNVSRETFDYCITRAVSKLNIIAEYCLPFTKLGGKMFAYKALSYKEELQSSLKAIEMLGGKYNKTVNINLLTLNNEVLTRNLIIIDKTRKTDKKYPRQKNLIEKNPL